MARLSIVTAATPAAPQGADNTLRRLMPLAAGHVPAQRPFLQHFVTAFVPQLLDVLAGRLHLAGYMPRNREYLEKSGADWRLSYLAAKVGIVSEVLVQSVDPDDQELAHATDRYYAFRAGLIYDLKLLLRYFNCVLKDMNPWRSHHRHPAFPPA